MPYSDPPDLDEPVDALDAVLSVNSAKKYFSAERTITPTP